ncbi:MAG: DUF4079 family protein [Candidatus Tectomicrobia bacterium]|uniref:DUF4079 family protein n=1 Tax=Tectimicrobiota bacterium TaxID=2528274 RepID=A0A932ZT97_UNCTE|nr:DUF4079 family protein [Candidatus Tectomicrobia bacterium]MBI3025179.1 DUF4079 family protein [Candidatus Tectomicrobia bacterium]MBI4251216.1 DUF4079 family protein [Candidatus Tectomicrobia bacterium]
MRTLAPYLHPAFQVCVLALGLWVLRLGLGVRRARRGAPGPGRARLAGRHMRLARGFTGLLALGYLLGLAGMGLALGEPLLRTAHGYFATLALALLLLTAYLGRRLRLAPGREDLRQIHSYAAFLTIFLCLAVAFLGMNLLP